MELRRYLTVSGKDVFGNWIADVDDPRAKAKIAARLARMEVNNFGDSRAVGDGVWELRIDWGPGYRIYYAMATSSIVVLLCGGDKRKQTTDIARAKAYWKDYKRRTAR